MKSKEKLIDFDFLGGQGSLTVEEEKALSVYFNQKKVTLMIKKQLLQNQNYLKTLQSNLFEFHK
ncbi:hypothetical protein [Flavobacterium sp.]|jgi:hypothetical protein|uniref:hypothetical protein n=1 Tax=Flavobacterium sp. TaxID=239 RepID=UPI0037BEDFCF